MKKFQPRGSDAHQRVSIQAKQCLPSSRLGSWSERPFMAPALTFLIILLAAGALGVAFSQTNKVTEGNRFLLVVEISKSMEQRGNGALHTIQHLLASGMSGQMRDGDTLGVWTYNSQLYTGRFPLQHWSAENHNSVAQKALLFVQSQTCEKQGNLALVMPALQNIVKGSRILTVVLVSDGQQKIHGTDFDADINKLYDTWRNEQEKARMPLITVLRAVNGKWSDFRVNAAPWPVEMPPMPKLTEIAKPAEKPAQLPKIPARSTTNLFLYGKTLSDVERNPDTPTTNLTAASANLIPANAIVITSRPTQAQSVTSSVTNTPVGQSPVLPATPSALTSDSKQITKSDLAPAQSEIVKSSPQDSTVSAAGTRQQSSSDPSLPNNPPAIEGQKVDSAPQIVSTQTTAPSSLKATPASSPSQAQNPNPRSSSSLATVVGAPSKSNSLLTGRAVIAISALVVAAAAIAILWIRNRSNDRVSLITRSLSKRE